MKLEDLKKQYHLERLAREAEKLHGVACALNVALTECKGADVQEVAGAFDAMEDIARDLAKDLEVMSDDESGKHHHVSSHAVEDRDIEGTGAEIGDSRVNPAVQDAAPGDDPAV